MNEAVAGSLSFNVDFGVAILLHVQTRLKLYRYSRVLAAHSHVPLGRGIGSPKDFPARFNGLNLTPVDDVSLLTRTYEYRPG